MDTTVEFDKRKVVLLAAVVVAATLSIKSNIAVAQMANPNTNTMKLLSDGMNPYAATAKPAVRRDNQDERAASIR